MHFEVFLGADTRWYWRLQTASGETIADSGHGFWNRGEAERGIALVKQAGNAPVRHSVRGAGNKPSTAREPADTS